MADIRFISYILFKIYLPHRQHIPTMHRIALHRIELHCIQSNQNHQFWMIFGSFLLSRMESPKNIQFFISFFFSDGILRHKGRESSKQLKKKENFYWTVSLYVRDKNSEWVEQKRIKNQTWAANVTLCTHRFHNSFWFFFAFIYPLFAQSVVRGDGREENMHFLFL